MKQKQLDEPKPNEKSLANKLAPTSAPRGFASSKDLPPSESIKQPFQKLTRLKQMAEDQEASLKDTNEEIRKTMMECIDILGKHGLRNAKLEGIGTVFIQEATHVNVPKAQQQELIAELKERGFESLIRTDPTVHSGSLKGLVEELRENGEPALKNCTVFFEKKIGIRK